jgi:hypothetical protein
MCIFEVKNITSFFRTNATSCFIPSFPLKNTVFFSCPWYNFVYSCNSRLYRINCWIRIISDPLRKSVLTFQDPINVSMLYCLIRHRFPEFIRGFPWIFPHTPLLRSVGVIPTCRPSVFLGLRTARNQQLRPGRSRYSDLHGQNYESWPLR